jgi:adenylate cyclase
MKSRPKLSGAMSVMSTTASPDRSLQLFPGWVGPYRWLASCYAHMGRLDEAGAMVVRLRGATSDVGLTAMRYRNLEHRELFLLGLRLAAGGDT